MKNDKQRIAELERRVKELEGRPPITVQPIFVPVPSPRTAPYLPPVTPYIPPDPWCPQPHLPPQPYHLDV